ncbi:uncharacterized protein LOC113303082 isoform X2 [Papaver somniferum]|uniref:uncharacterized protein LOC113303082 isoform X2 n=1 Tax=Papaver somniferum TaxID=3469 RepID=UPI000E6F5EC2|nr:uncharacterized protein LOC113303082 isoform X2 [Papaver somniferum]
MHIEKNVCENILGTLLELDKKCKDGLKARQDLKEMRIRPRLHPEFDAVKNKYYLPAACYYLDKDRKELFCTVLNSLKIPDGYSSNIGRHVKVKERKLVGMKSHDLHVIMQQFLPLAIRKTLPTKVSSVLIELSLFFRELCSKTLLPEDLRLLEKSIAVTLCNLERIFPPAFFDFMVHLLIHLASEALLGGPVQYRWMYPVERYLKTLKSYVRNMAQPEGSIAEGYIADECVTFMARYLDQVETRLDRPSRYTENSHIGGLESFMLDTAEKKLAHAYILFNHDGVQTYLEKKLLR